MEHEGKLEDKGGRKEVYVRGYGGGGGGIKLGLEPTGNEGRRVKKKEGVARRKDCVRQHRAKP